MGKISDEDGFISLGPWGSGGGALWNYKADGPIIEIVIRYGEIIDSISIGSKSPSEVHISNEKFGGLGGHREKMFCINTSEEQLSLIQLTQIVFEGESVIGSISFSTTRNSYEAKGGQTGGSSVSIPIEGGVISGFHGRAGKYINAFGIVLASKVDHKKIEEELKTEIEDLTTKTKGLKEREDELLMKMKEVEGKNEELRKMNKEEVEGQEIKIKELNDKADELRMNATKVEEQNEVLRRRKKGKVDELAIKIKELKEKKDGLRMDMAKVEAQNEVLRERNKVLEKEVKEKWWCSLNPQVVAAVILLFLALMWYWGRRI